MSERLPSIRQCEDALKEPAHKWVARCYEIAWRIHAAGLVPGRPVYGHWLGPVHPQSHFGGRYRLPFQRHGWVLMDEDTGKVFDPTRWVFEAAEPYLFVGEPPDVLLAACRECECLEEEHTRTGFFRPCRNTGCACPDYQAPEPWPYDEGGDRLRRATMRPVPPGEGAIVIHLPAELRDALGLPFRMTEEQVCWLANLPYSVLGEHANTVYRALQRRGQVALIPIDNLHRARARERRRRVGTAQGHQPAPPVPSRVKPTAAGVATRRAASRRTR
jgi:hypothetical protein